MDENEKSSRLSIMIGILIIITALVIIFGIFGYGDNGYGMMGGSMMGGGWLFMVLPIAFLIILIITLTDRDNPQNNPSPYYVQETPIQILERRYANGEITRDEYHLIKKDILMGHVE